MRGRAALRLLRHEMAQAAALARWITRRPPHGAGSGDTAVSYASAQAAVMWVMTFVSLLETVVLALIIPWPLVHLVLLVLGIWGTLFGVELHAASVTRPHLVGADGSLRVRYGVLLDIAVPADRVGAVRLDPRFPGGKQLVIDEDGTTSLNVAGQTNVTVDLTGPVPFARPLGAPAEARTTLRFYADDPRAAIDALTRARDAAA
ncbi:hypothetical protein [Streptomyces sp. PT12]|uniref:hypothetical protein n=1 Tax=Streptomyces sp. PT12 TaxID=1510197 RepID=UPI000DE388D4|nr:hypothetical protein [Streptomyces sp. PT12]RBM22430.1 hypothetical protein DEH69_04270 [Streptomyces sp. PT12]